MKRTSGLLAAFAMMAIGAIEHDPTLAANARRAGITWNPYSGQAVANGNPFYAPTKSQQVKSKRRAAQRRK